MAFPGVGEAVPAVRTIGQWLLGQISTKQKVAVLLAPGGLGKTTLTRQLFSIFSSNPHTTRIPILINSNAWGRNRDIISDMEDVWRYALRECYPDAGLSSDMLQRCLFLGTLCPIFDGLDELCTILPWDFKPDETISELIDTFEDSPFGDGRLLITSRQTFWTEFISPNLIGKILEIKLHPFSRTEREEYLGMRFPDLPGARNADKRERAQRVLSRIANRTGRYQQTPRPNEAAGDVSTEPYRTIEFVPFVVMLTADSADTGENDVTAMYGDKLASADPLRGILLAICERERVRHHLPQELSAERQLALLETLAGEFGSQVSGDDIELVLLDSGMNPSFRQNFIDHQLLGIKGRIYEFTYDFVYEYLRASLLLKWLRGDSGDRAPVNVLLDCATQPGNLLDGTADLMLSVLGDAWSDLAKNRYDQLFRTARAGLDRRCQAGFFHVVSAVARRQAQRASRLEKILVVFGSPEEKIISGVYIEGSIDNLDLRGVGLKGVTFGNIEFTHCEFNDATKIVDCHFEANLHVDNCRGFGLIQCQGGSMTPQARSIFQREQVNGIDRRITREQLDDSIGYILRKFKRGEGFKTCKDEGVRGTANNMYGFGGDVVDALIKYDVLQSFQIGPKRMLKIRAAGDAYQFLNNNYRRGQIDLAFQRLVEDFT